MKSNDICLACDSLLGTSV